MSKRNKRKNMGKGKTLAIAAVLAAPGLACTAGWNSLEQSVNCDDSTARTRMINNLAYEVGSAELSYHGLNQLDDFDGATYSGVNRFMLRNKGGKVRGLVRLCTAGDGTARPMLGVRVPQFFGDYGFTDITSDKNGANLTIYAGKKLGGRRTLEFLHSQNWAYEGKPSAYNELQLNQGFHPHWEALARAEVPNYDAKEARLMLGARWKK